jgi:hypothetical protein
LRVIEASEDPTRRNTGKREVAPTKVFTFDDEHERVRYVRADMQTGNGLVQRRLAAERVGVMSNPMLAAQRLLGSC